MMETLQPALKNGRNVWDRINMPLREFHERVDVVRSKMKEHGVDTLLAYGHAFNEYGNSCYLTNYQMRLPRGTLVAVPENRAPALFFEGASRGLPSARLLTWVEDIRPCPDVAVTCVRYLKEKGLASGVIGLTGLNRWMPRYQMKSLLDSLPGCRVLPMDRILEEMRMVKSSRETDQIRRASRIVRRGFEFLSDASFASMNERVVEASLFREARMEGAEDVRVLFGTPGKFPWAVRPAENSVLDHGSVFIVYLAVAYERYWSEGIRTFMAERETFSSPDLTRLDSLYRKSMECLQPGKAISRCCNGIRRVLQEAGVDVIEDYGLGQGVGLSLNERPFLRDEAGGTLEEGMCLSLRLGIRDESMGALMMGDTFGVSKTGLEGLAV
jgi:Xaa-Pro aminopeptidase